MEILGVHHIQMTAPKGCEPDARAFYVGLLGLEEIAKPKTLQDRGGVWFRTPSGDIHIAARESDTPPSQHRHVALRVKSADTLRRKLQQANIKIEEAPEVSGWRRFFAYDPFGNKIEILEIIP